MSYRRLTLDYVTTAGPAAQVTLGDDLAGEVIRDYKVSTRSPAQVVNLPRADAPDLFDRQNDLTTIEWVTNRQHASESDALDFVDTHPHACLRLGTFTSVSPARTSVYLTAKVEECECLYQAGLTTEHRYRLLAGLPS